MSAQRGLVLKLGFLQQVLRYRPARSLPRPSSSTVLAHQLRSRQYPHWTAWYVPYCDVENDLWGQSHFNFDVDGHNYHVLRTGAFPFVKFHCTRRPLDNLDVEDTFYRLMKVVNLGIPTLAYGLAGLLWAKHEETLVLPSGTEIVIYFWYKETRGARY